MYIQRLAVQTNDIKLLYAIKYIFFLPITEMSIYFHIISPLVQNFSTGISKHL